MQLHQVIASALALTAACAVTPAHAWGPDGHHTVGALADQLLAGTPAGRKVRAVLGGMSLRDAAVWADCAKGIDPAHDFAYPPPGPDRRYPECAPHETPAGIAAMADFVRRNPKHKEYHYTDVAVQRSHYASGLAGTTDHDVVAAIGAALLVLRGQKSPPPFDIASPREALLLLAHFVGDIHQPLHVGSVYLDAQGQRVDPDHPGPEDPATFTVGGNSIIKVDARSLSRFGNLHRTWDDIPAALLAGHIDAAWLAQAHAVPPTPGAVAAWPATWANGSLLKARAAFARIRFGPKVDREWTATLPLNYNADMTAVKKEQLTLGGARLAQILQSVWP
jgi:hypothetical protein